MVRNGEKSFTADDFPSLLYDPQLVQQDDALAGFLRGSFLLKVRRGDHIDIPLIVYSVLQVPVHRSGDRIGREAAE